LNLFPNAKSMAATSQRYVGVDGLIEVFKREIEIGGAGVDEGFFVGFVNDRAGERGRVLGVDVFAEVAPRQLQPAGDVQRGQ